MKNMSSEETTPMVKNTNNPIMNLKQKRDIKREEVRGVINAKLNSAEPNYVAIYICATIIILSFSLCIVYIISYYVDTYAAREVINNRKVSISEKWINYSSPDEVSINCTNIDPCRGIPCIDVREDFNKEMHECKYKDWMDYFNISLVILLVIGTLQCCCGKNNKVSSGKYLVCIH